MQHLNMNDGLQNNTILSIGEDYQGNLWLGTDHGIDYIENNSPLLRISNNYGISTGYAAINKPSSDNEIDNDTKVDIILGIAFGAEYFLDEHFSIGVEAQGNLTQSDEKSIRFGNPDGTNFNTATMITATVYFQ